MKRTKRKTALRKITEAPKKPAPLTRPEITARDHRDLSTYEINCRISGLMNETTDLEHAISSCNITLKDKQRRLKVVRADIQALEQLVESRR